MFSLLSAIFWSSPIILNEQPIKDSNTSSGTPPAPENDPSPTENAAAFAKSLNQDVMQLYASFLSEDGTSVDYKSLSQSNDFKNFQYRTQLLKQCQLTDLSQDEKKALFLNLYNMIVIHAYCTVGIPSNMGDRLKFYKNAGYRIGKDFFSLDDIEHGILRGNSKHPAFYSFKSPFSKDDPRMVHVLPKDPRIHFALVCGAKSCPPIRIYTAKNLNFGLNAAAKNFLRTGFKIENGNHIYLSMILKWYHVDFGANEEEVLRYISQYLDEERKQQLEELLRSKKYKVHYMKYNWEVNGTV